MIYLFVGQDSLSKDIKLKNLKQQFLLPQIAQFNLDTLYARELTLRDFQEKILCLPILAQKRFLVIRQAEFLKQEIKDYLLQNIKRLSSELLLVLDINRHDPKDEFIQGISRYCQVYGFREEHIPNTFELNGQMNLHRPDYALRLLQQLLKNGEKPERILGGLRYSWERDIPHSLEKRRRMRILLDCDKDIKTGRLKAQFALEKLVIDVCSQGKLSYAGK